MAPQESQRLVLDTRGLRIIEVTGAELGPKGRSSEALGEALELRLPKPLAMGETATLRMAYATGKDAVAIQMLAPEQTRGKQHPYLFTQCQAIHARCLMPCQDTPGAFVRKSSMKKSRIIIYEMH